MNKQEVIAGMSCLLNRGQGADLSYFVDKKHEDLVKDFAVYLEAHCHLFPAWKLTDSHAPNESGVDILLETETVKLGFQLKSPFDVSEKHFSANVKRQTLESMQHGLDKYYVLICSPLKQGKKNYAGKISHLFNELSKLKTMYLATYTPPSTICYFDPATTLSKDDFNAAMQRISYEKTNIDELKDLLSQAKPPVGGEDLFDRLEKKNVVVPETFTAIHDYFELEKKFVDEEVDEIIEDVKGFLEILAKKLPLPSRQFLCIVLSVASSDSYHCGAVALCEEVEQHLSLSAQQLQSKVSVLNQHRLAEIEYDDESRTASIELALISHDLDLLSAIKEICSEKDVDLRKVICDLDFSVLD